MHDDPAFFGGYFSEGGDAYLFGVFKLGKEGLQQLQVVHHGGVAAALGGRVVARGAWIKLGVERHVLILVVHKLAELHY